MAYLAMTAAELCCCDPLPPHIAWMACHFSPYGTGLTNLPTALPPDSLLILNDRTPVSGHDPALVAELLQETVEKFHCRGILLDFQRPNCPQTASIAAKITQLPCPVILSQYYAKDLSCAVLLPPVPLLQTVEEHIAAWRGREVWLEAALEAAQFTLTQAQSKRLPLPMGAETECPLYDAQLHLHYRIDVSSDRAIFTLQRSREDLKLLLDEAEALGVAQAVGLWQELG